MARRWFNSVHIHDYRNKMFNKQISSIMYYVTMTDRCLSGWGRAKGKISKVVIECSTNYEASAAYNANKCRKDMIFVSIARTRPHYNAHKYDVEWCKFNKDTRFHF